MYKYTQSKILDTSFDQFFPIVTGIIDHFNIYKTLIIDKSIIDTLWKYYHIKVDDESALYLIFRQQLYLFLINYSKNASIAVRYLYISKLCLGMFMAQSYEHPLTVVNFDWDKINKALSVCDTTTQNVIRANIKIWFKGV